MRTKKHERQYISWRRERIYLQGSARGSPTIADTERYPPAKQLSTGEKCVLLRRRLGLSTTTVTDLVGISHVTVIEIENDRTKDRHGYQRKLKEACLKHNLC